MERKPYHWMTTHTPQSGWIEGEGKLIWLALFFMEAGAGLTFFSIVSNNLLGFLLGWFMVLALGGGAFLVHMGRPLRAFRAVMRPQTSWIARGIIFISLFGILGAIHILMLLLTPNSNLFTMQILTGIFCFLVAIYGGVLLSYVKALPLWNTGLLPLVYIVAGFWGGAELLLIINLLTGAPLEIVEPWIKVLLPSFVLLVPLYLMTVRHSSTTGSKSVRRILAGDLAGYFYIGVIVVGLLFPLIVLGFSSFAGFATITPPIFVIAIICGLIGDLTMRFCIMKGALYRPLISGPASGSMKK